MSQLEKEFTQKLEAIIDDMAFMVSLDNMRVAHGSRQTATGNIQYKDDSLAHLYLYDEERTIIAEIVQ